jgi:hypothetical protein
VSQIFRTVWAGAKIDIGNPSPGESFCDAILVKIRFKRVFHGRAASNSRKDGNDEATAKQNVTSAHGDFLKKFGELHLKE